MSEWRGDRRAVWGCIVVSLYCTGWEEEAAQELRAGNGRAEESAGVGVFEVSGVIVAQPSRRMIAT
jgi:hypothetical protein